ncbi:hypothetical protein Trichorick_01436 (plasmid) [Candidatus Trichorickettsia mobilis]|uniref:Uncharacterized protein n=1 Tax=Candidatus Trichorickettsia mobilis TaxID=1346319 RepID=A0ABZ0UWW6_9RICK|nr:hypothetical protein Trichorick_01436 [Candidatus Trichorickettsia mobilis]
MKTLMLIITQGVLTLAATWFIVMHIEKHSTHPIHGNFVETSYKCQPWDSCR